MNAAWLDHWLERTPDRTRLTTSRSGIRFVPTAAGDVRIRHRPGPGLRLFVGVDGPDGIEHHDGLLAALDPSTDVVVMEPPGTGGSRPARGFVPGLDAHARVVDEVLAALGGPRHLVMPCWLGFVAARVDPRHVVSLTLPQTPPWADMQTWVRRVDPRGLLRTPLVGQLVVALRRRAVIDGWYRASLGHRDQHASTVETANRVQACGGCFGLASLIQGLQSEHAPERPVQAHVVWGERDRTHRFSDPGPHARRFADAGHRPHLEEPEPFVAWWQEAVDGR